jgi:DNA-binding response OmpR family regulator
MDVGANIGHEPAYVLIVDDEGPIRYSARKSLERVGYTVSEASSGETALEMISQQQPEFDVILTDIRMEGMDGVELLRRIKEQSPDAIVILMTGFASLGSAVEAVRLGAHDYLFKPTTNHDIRQSVARGVERARNLRRRRRLLETIKNDVYELTRADRDAAVAALNTAPPTDIDEAAYQDNVPEPTSGSMQLGPLTVHTGRYQISVDSNPIDLTPTEFDLLLYLAAHRGRVVPCHELVREVRGYTVEEAEAREVVRPHVSNLRRKLKEANQDEDLIVNVRGIGYRLNDRLAPLD